MTRDLFNHRIQKGLIGPGSENWGIDDEEEIISDYPLVRYFSGVIFPDKEVALSENEEDEQEGKNETEEPNQLIIDEGQGELYISEKERKLKEETESETENKANQNHFNPNNIALTFCVEKKIESIEIVFSGGFYYSPNQSEIKIKMPEAGYTAFTDEKLGFPFRDILHYEDGFLSLTRELKGDKGGKNQRSGDYLWFDDFKKTDSYKDSSAKYYMHYFERLIGRTWKRKNFHEEIVLKIEDTTTPKPLPVPEGVHKEISIGYNIKTYESSKAKGKLYVKVQLVNLSKQSSRRFTNKTPELNQKCLFQATIKVNSANILPFKSTQELNPFDHEAEELNLLYRNVKSYGIGHNCSVDWLSETNSLKTTFLPEYNIKDTKNDFREADFTNKEDFEKLDTSLGIRNLSIFSELSKNEIKASLLQFVELYGNWISTQKNEIQNLSEQQQNVSKGIITKLDSNYSRLKDNIECLDDSNVFRAFQLANTAMLIQIIISNDKHFTKTEKEVSEINDLTEYNDLSFFETYDYSRIPSKPKYRPFQLAFLLLSLKGIAEPQSKDRKEIVDLIWFPTGGGKTEAYLAVTAFSIIYRRLINTEKQSSGVSVIMRYTLRLLTAQQFERSSKLISALEFLRKNFPDELKKETISIGLWVGNEITPGTVEKAFEKIEDIEKECLKDNGQPESKNPFQISACPWCGTKLISEGNYGFEAEAKSFKIRCLNNRCAFHKGIPVQVVDEMLFKQPPTLLFATVDKFAQIAWKEDAHKFFNSLDRDKLPPDLIIQDEMHLLSGPLGSIVGIFESLVEKLCTNEELSLMPKIIASTATTRNTTEQVAQLYGGNTSENGRKVNIFPPSGISYDDSFFARESKEKSRRKYIGFMPVGKTSIDTQLHIIAHLLVARVESGEPIDDDYWTIVSYYNSLKDVGKIRNKVGDEVLYNTKQLQARVLGNNSYAYNHFGLEDRTEELTARVDSSKIKSVLKQLEYPFEFVDRVSKSGEKYKAVNSSVIDLVLATNMFSVGIDISRLNIMLMNGMPKNIAEYIQASSRVGRKSYGLVVAFLDANRARDKSHFEHFVPFHQAFYKSIEPLSVTPFTENTIDKMLTTVMVAYLRHKVPGLNKDNTAKLFKPENIEELKVFLKNRFGKNESEYSFFESKINFLAADWQTRIQNGTEKYSQLMKRPTETGISEKDDWIVMQSMREVDADTYVEIKQTFAANFKPNPRVKPMSKYIKSQSRKMLSAYGGVGSILETPKGALKIEEFDKWYFHNSGSYNIPEYEIEENRLIGRLKSHFPKLQKLVRIPTNEEDYRNKTVPIKPKEVASAKYFPEWLYCPNCEKFNHIKQWWANWRMTLQRHLINDEKIKEWFIKPKCFHCYDKAKTEKKGKRYQELEQVRFVMTSPSGEIRDIPWNLWTTIEKNVKEEDADGGNIKFNDPCCGNQDLKYLRSETFADLAGVRIQCVNPECQTKGKQVTLAGLFGMRIGKEKITQFKPVIRTSNSVYYPLSINSIYLPKKVQEITGKDKDKITALLEKGKTKEDVYDFFDGDYEKQTIDEFIGSGTHNDFEPEIQYRLKEYQFIIENPNFNDEEKNNLKYENQDTTNLSEFSIGTLLKVKRLKLTAVQTAYTRQEPLDKDLFLSNGDANSNVKVKYTSSQSVNTSYLLATESYGEGIFIDFDKSKIESWFFNHYDNTPEFKRRIDEIKKRVMESEMVSDKKFQSERHIAKFILVHTLTHILIKELEFLCGYAATSINERLFIDDENMQGVLIYTVAGSEGSYGGLTSQANPEAINKILHSAIYRSRDCSSDPVCYHSEGQGIGGLNLAACYSCSLLPETSCEEFNGFLDRALLINSEFGFFKHIKP